MTRRLKQHEAYNHNVSKRRLYRQRTPKATHPSLTLGQSSTFDPTRYYASHVKNLIDPATLQGTASTFEA